RYHLGSVLAKQRGKQKEAEAAYQEAQREQQALAKAFLLVAGYRRDLARTLNNLGILRRTLGRPDWEEPISVAVGLQRKLVEESPQAAGPRRELARSLSNLGTQLRENGKIPAAEEAYRESIRLLVRLRADFPTVPDYRQELAAVQSNLGLLLQADPNRLAEAEAAF